VNQIQEDINILKRQNVHPTVSMRDDIQQWFKQMPLSDMEKVEEFCNFLKVADNLAEIVSFTLLYNF